MEKQPNSVSIVCGSAKITLEFEKTPIRFQDALCLLEETVIGHFLKRHDGIKARVAQDLTLNRTTLVEKAKKYGFPLKK